MRLVATQKPQIVDIRKVRREGLGAGGWVGITYHIDKLSIVCLFHYRSVLLAQYALLTKLDQNSSSQVLDQPLLRSIRQRDQI